MLALHYAGRIASVTECTPQPLLSFILKSKELINTDSGNETELTLSERKFSLFSDEDDSLLVAFTSVLDLLYIAQWKAYGLPKTLFTLLVQESYSIIVSMLHSLHVVNNL